MSFRSANCHSGQAKRVEESVLYSEENGFFDLLSLTQNDTNLMALPTGWSFLCSCNLDFCGAQTEKVRKREKCLFLFIDHYGIITQTFDLEEKP